MLSFIHLFLVNALTSTGSSGDFINSPFNSSQFQFVQESIHLFTLSR